MGWDVVSLYFVIGELATLLVLNNEESAGQVRSLAQREWWAPYAWANVMILAWPAAAPLFLLLFKSK
jgi:hypothetical protein